MATLFYFIQYTLFCYFTFFAFLNFVLSISAKINKIKKNNQIHKYYRFAILIPGYKEDNVILETTQSALKQNYPEDKFTIIVIADHFEQNTVNQLKKLSIITIETEFKNSTKAKALNAAFSQLDEKNYDIAIVLDADNIMEANFLDKVNNAYLNGYSFIQTHRVAKKLNGKMTILDAISEEINNSLYRKGMASIGLSSAIIGSGMAFEFSYFKKLMESINAIGGFDKEIELKMLKDKKRIYYLEDAYIYDEKVSKLNIFYNQRRRWLSSQIHYFKAYFIDSLVDLILKRNLDYFVKALQMAQPPRLFLLGFSLIISILSFIPFIKLLYPHWLLLFFIVIATLIIATPNYLYNKQTLKSLTLLPNAFLTMLYSLITIKGANKSFIHTPHTDISTKNN